jgi:hypothetical protein
MADSPHEQKTPDNKVMHPSRRLTRILKHRFFAATWVIAAVLS